MNNRRIIQDIVVVVTLAVLAIVPFAGVLDNFFCAPDTLAQIATARVHSFRDIVRIFSEPMLQGTTATEAVLWYRPVAILSQSIDYALWGLNPFGFHLTDLILHAWVTLMTYAFMVILTRRRSIAWLTAVLFALHPVHIEVVPAIARRHDALAMVFMYASLFLFVRGRGGSRLLGALSLVAFAGALASKEIAAIFPGLLIAWVAATSPPAGRSGDEWRRWAIRSIAPALPYVALTIVYMAWRGHVLEGLGGDLHAAPVAAPQIVDRYFRGLLDPQHFAVWRVAPLAVAAWLVAALWIVGRVLRRRELSDGWSLAFLAFWLLLPLAVMLATSSFAVRRVYVAVIPLSAILSLVGADTIALLRQRGPVAQRVIGGMALAVVLVATASIVFSSPLIRRYPQWEQSAAFTELFFDRFEAVVPELSNGSRVRIEGLPKRFPQPAGSPTVAAEGWLTGHAIESWMRLRHPDMDVTVRLGARAPEAAPPDDLLLQLAPEADGVVVIDVRPVQRQDRAPGDRYR